MEDKINIKNYLKCDNENTIDQSAVLDLYSRIDVDFKTGPAEKNKHWNLYISSKTFLRVHKNKIFINV